MAEVTVDWVAHGPDVLPTVEAALRARKADDPLRTVTVVVPTNSVGVTLRRRFARLRWPDGRVGVTAVHLLTAFRLAELLASGPGSSPAGSPPGGARRLPVTTAAVATAVRAALADPPAALAPVAGESATEEVLVDTHRRLSTLWADPTRTPDETPAALARLATAGGPAAAAVEVHRTVRRILAERGFRDEADQVRRAVQALTDRPAAAAALGHVLVVLPQRLGPGELALLRAVADHVPLHVVAATVGHPDADREVRATVAALGARSDGPAPGASTHPGLRAVSVTDPDEEVREVTRLVLADLQADPPVPAERIAVLLSAREPYARLVRDRFAAAGITWNGRSVVSLAHRLRGRVTLALLALPHPDAPTDPTQGWERDDLVRLWEAGPLAWYPDRTTGVLRTVPSDRWRRLAVERRARRGADWTPPAPPGTTRPGHDTAGDTAGEAPDDAAHRTEGPEADGTGHDPDPAWLALTGWVAGVRRHLDPVVRARTWTEATDALVRAVDAVGGTEDVWGQWGLLELPGGAVEAAAVDRIVGRIRSLASLDAFGGAPDWRTFVQTVEAVLTDDLAREGRSGEGVLVGSLADAVALDADRVYVLGAAEEQLPPATPPDPLLPAEVLAEPDLGLETSQDRAHRAHRHFLAALAGPAVPTVLWSRSDLDQSAERHRPRWLPADVPDRTAPSFLAGVGTPVAATVGEHRLARLVSAGRGAGAHDAVLATGLFRLDTPARRGWAAAAARLSSRFTAYDGNLTALAAELGPDAAEAFGAPRARPLAVTALEQYAGQPQAWFLTRVLGVRALDDDVELETHAGEMGSAIHRALDRWAGQPGRPLGTADEEHARLAAELAAELAELGRRRVLGPEAIATIRTRRHFRDAHRFVDGYLQLASADPGRTLAASEWALGTPEAPAEVLLPDGRRLLLTGRADRVDRTGAGLDVIDVKTGTNWDGWAEKDPVANLAGGARIQSAVYALVAREQLVPGATELQATWWYLKQRTGPYKQDRRTLLVDAAVEEAILALLGELDTAIADGVFPFFPTSFPTPDAVLFPDGIKDVGLEAVAAAKRTDPRIPPTLRGEAPGGGS